MRTQIDGKWNEGAIFSFLNDKGWQLGGPQIPNNILNFPFDNKICYALMILTCLSPISMTLGVGIWVRLLFTVHHLVGVLDCVTNVHGNFCVVGKVTNVDHLNLLKLKCLLLSCQWAKSIQEPFKYLETSTSGRGLFSFLAFFFMMNFYYPGMRYSYSLYRFYANWQHTILMFTQGNA
jgi:hypothetical protein